MSDWVSRAKDQLETHATTLHAIKEVGALLKKALGDHAVDARAVLWAVDKVMDALIAGFQGGKVSREDIAKYIEVVLKSEETVDEAADRKLAEKFGRLP